MSRMLTALSIALVAACKSPPRPPTDRDFVANPPAAPPPAPKPPPPVSPPSAPPAAAAAPEPAGDDSLFFDDDFSRGNHCDLANARRGFGWGEAQHGKTDSIVTVRDDASPSGCALAFIFQGNPDLADDAWAVQRFKVGKVNGDTVRELFVGFVIRLPTNYRHRQPKGGDNNKLLRLWDRDYGKSMVHIGMSTTRRGSSGASQMIVEYSTPKGTGSFNTGPWSPAFRANGVDTVGFFVRLGGGPGTPDGVIRVWWNRRLVYDRSNLPLIKAQSAPGAFNGFGNGYLLGWANSGFSERTELHVWRFLIAPQPLPWFLP